MATKKTKKGGKKGAETLPFTIEDKPNSQVEEILSEQLPIEEKEENKIEETLEIEVKPENVEDEHYEVPVLTKIIVLNYEGELEKGLYNDESGEAFFEGGSHFKGNFQKGEMHGEGIYTWPDGLVYEGEIDHNKLDGRGKYTWPDGTIYDGQVSNGIRHGFGVLKTVSGKKYSGNWVYGKRHGHGKMEYDMEGQSFYDGTWVENVKQGWGHRRYHSGNIYEGNWWQDRRHGFGKLTWVNKEYYEGEFCDGIQHGRGQHVWLSESFSKDTSQYPLKNIYNGEWVNAKRNGFGIFYYANGARYEGEWKDNRKHGNGKFLFKNGRIYEGEFSNDHIVDYPDWQMDGNRTPDLARLRTRTPLSAEMNSIHSVLSNESRNTIGPSFQLKLPNEFQPSTDDINELEQVKNILIRYISQLRKVYNFYSCLGLDELKENDEVNVMDRLQFWRFLKDIKLIEKASLYDLDILLDNRHDPDEPILFRDFLQYLVYLSNFIRENELLQQAVERLITNFILKFSCVLNGYIFTDTRRTWHIITYRRELWMLFEKLYPQRYVTARQLIFLIKDLKLLSNDLNTTKIIDILAKDDPIIRRDNDIYLERNMVFLEFYEALVAMAEIYVTPKLAKEFLEESFAEEEVLSKANLSIVKSESIKSVLSNNVNKEEESKSKATDPEPEVDFKSRFSDQSSEKMLSENPSRQSSLDDVVCDENESPKLLEEDESKLKTSPSINENDKQYHLWTHQLHVWLKMKVLPAIYDELKLQERVEAKKKFDLKHEICKKRVKETFEEEVLKLNSYRAVANSRDTQRSQHSSANISVNVF